MFFQGWSFFVATPLSRIHNTVQALACTLLSAKLVSKMEKWVIFEHICKPTGNQFFTKWISRTQAPCLFFKIWNNKILRSRWETIVFSNFLPFHVEINTKLSATIWGEKTQVSEWPTFYFKSRLNIKKTPKTKTKSKSSSSSSSSSPFFSPFSYPLPLYYFICGHLVKGNLFPLAQNYLQLNLGCFAATFFALASLK